MTLAVGSRFPTEKIVFENLLWHHRFLYILSNPNDKSPKSPIYQIIGPDIAKLPLRGPKMSKLILFSICKELLSLIIQWDPMYVRDKIYYV